MNDIAKKVGAPGLPQVNLIPKELAEKRAMRAVQVTALFAVLIAVGLIVVGYVLALGAKTLAQNELEDARSEQSQALEARDAKVTVYDNALVREQQEYTLAQIGYGEVDYSQLSASVLATANADSSFDEVHFLGPSALGLGSVQEGFYGGGVGSVEFVARTSSSEEATALIARLEAVPGIAKARGTAEEYVDDGGSTYWGVTGSALITDVRLTGRILPEEGITGIEPAVIAGGETAAIPTPEPSPTAEPSEES